MTIKELEAKIRYYSQKYYEGYPEITNAEFDKLTDALKTLDPTNPILTTPGWGYKPVGGDTEHFVFPIKGIDLKIKAKDLGKRASQLPDVFTLQPKLDGGSVVAYYDKGKLIKAVTRGDGKVGVDVTKNLLHCIPGNVDFMGKLAVRGEVIVTVEDFDEQFKPAGYVAIRNTPNGVVKLLDDTKGLTKFIRFIACDILTDISNGNFMDTLRSIQSKFEWVNQMKCYRSSFEKEAENTTLYGKLLTLKDGKHFAYDGWVMKTWDVELETLPNGWSKVSPKLLAAYKFEEEKYVTKVKDIEWNLSPLGTMVPTGIVEEVITDDGIHVSRVSLTSYGWMDKRKCGRGATVEIIRANDVIPHLESVLTESTDYSLPKMCPACGFTLQLMEDEDKDTKLVCSNGNCTIKERETLYRVFEWPEIKGLGRTLIDRVLDSLQITKLEHLDSFLANDPVTLKKMLYNIVGDKRSELFMTVFNALQKEPTIAEVLHMSNLPTFGTKVCQNFGQMTNEEFVTTIKIKQIPDSWNKYAVNYLNVDVLQENVDRVYSVLKFFFWTLKENKTSSFNLGWKVCVTGSVLLGRKEWYKALGQFGVLESGVNKDTTYLVSNDKNTTSGKFEKAKKLGVPIVEEKEFYEILALTLQIPQTDVQVRMGM